jgi:nucleoid-associated protein YgaU
MRNFIKYVLVTAVLLFGFHTASKFKASSPQQSTANVAESETAALSSHPDAQPTGRDSGWQAPVAALNDMERSAEDGLQPESLDTFKQSTLQRQPTIEKPSSVEPFRSVDDWSSEESAWWDQEPCESKSEASQEPYMPEKPNSRKRAPAVKDSWIGKKPQDKRSVNGKANNDKRTKRPVETARSSRGTGLNDASSRQTKSAPAPEWPIGDRLASSSKLTFAEQLQKETQWPWQDEADTANRSISPFEPDRAGEGQDQSRLKDEMDQPVADKGKPRKPARNKQPAKDVQRLRTAEETERHRIVDGDTLPKLAVAYLGDRDRYLDIFEANRDVLSDPRLLPIGAELAIPTGQRQKSNQSTRPFADNTSETEWAADDGELVPIPTFALPPRISR